MAPIIEIENLVHRFADGTLGLDGISLAIEAGSFVVVAGANGSGKTTLLRHLNGLLLPSSGAVRVAGRAVGDDLLRVRRLVGMMFQDAESQIVGETVAEDVAFGPENLGLPRAQIRERVEAAMATTGIAHLGGMRSHTLSGGEKRRLAIAGLLAMEPQILACDEPFSSLDCSGVRQVLAQLLALNRAGRTVFVTTHDLDKVLAHADRLIVMSAGRIAMDGPPQGVVHGVEPYGVRNPLAAGGTLEALSWLA
jgi:biotin transport system ATP-binding protein